MKNSPLKICNVTIQPGERITLALPTPELYTFAPIYIPIHVIHGKKKGPTLLVCAAVSGDEINGVAIAQKLLMLKSLNSVKGTLIVIPAINVYGLMTMSRTLPDRRDLEGSFPGSETGSFASRLAYFLTEEVFKHITHCIDLHTGEPHITKFPQIKTNTMNPEANNMALEFEAPVILNTNSKEGLLWLLNDEARAIPTIIYEAGEALRLDGQSIKTGVQGVVRVMRSIGMLNSASKKQKTPVTLNLESEFWIRAANSGLCDIFSKVGAYVSKGTLLARISDPFGTEQKEEIYSPFDGVVIAKNNQPILNEGEPVLQVAEMKKAYAETIKMWSEDGKEY